MKGKKLIQLIEKHGFEDFEFQFCFTDAPEEGDTYPNVRTFTLTGISDVGHSNKTVDLEGEEIDK